MIGSLKSGGIEVRDAWSSRRSIDKSVKKWGIELRCTE
jgi:hypothetical protein